MRISDWSSDVCSSDLYHRGEFFSRDNIHPGMITLHPCGFPHGPHPKAFATGAKAARKETDEVAVMLDTRDALDVGAAAERSEERRVGKAGVSTCRFRWSPTHKKKNNTAKTKSE